MTKSTPEQPLLGAIERDPHALSKAQLDPLPDVPPPDLTDLSVDVPIPSPVTQDMLQTAAAELARAHGEVISREADQPIQPEDDVLVDLVGYAGGRVVPGSVRPQVWLTSDEEVNLPGIRAALNGETVGKSVQAKVKHPADAPVPALAGQELDYAVDILAARSIAPVALDAPGLLEAAGVAEVDDLLALIAEGLEAEREQTALHLAQMAVADALQARLGDVAISPAIIDAELDQQWNATEGTLLRDKGLSVDERTSARDAFVNDPGHRSQLEHGLRTTMALAALAKAHDLRPTREDLDAWLEEVAAVEDRPVDALRGELETDAQAREAVGQALLLDKALGWALERATLNWVEPDETRPPSSDA